MITLNASGGSITFEFSGNSTYLNDGTITVPVNSLALIIDESDMATFKKAASNDIFVSANVSEFGMTKAELESWFKENAVGSTGGGVDSGTVQTMIDESISGKADSSAVTEEISAAVSGKADTSYVDSAVSGKVDTTTYSAYTAATDSRLAEDEEVTAAALVNLNEALSGKLDTSIFEAYSGSVDTALSSKQDTLIAGENITISGNVISAEGGGKAIEAGRGISVTTGETADTVSFNLPISGSGRNIIMNSTTNNITGNSIPYNTFIGGELNTINFNGKSYSDYDIFVFGATNNLERTGGTYACNHLVVLGSNNNLIAEGPTTNTTIIGYQNKGTKDNQFIFGNSNSATTSYQYIFGYLNNPTNKYETSLGFYGASSSASTTFGNSGNTLLSVGNGTFGYYDYQRFKHNAFEIRQNGDIYIVDTNDTSTSNYYEKPMIKLQDHLGGGGSSYAAGDGIDITNDVISVTGMVETSAVTSAVTSGSTNVLTSGGAYEQFGGLKLVKLTESEYAALVDKDTNTLYVVIPDPSNP